MQVLLARYAQTSRYVRGALFAVGKTFYTLERPWLNNAANVSCIPVGEYDAVFLPRSGSGKYRNVYHVLHVIERSGILMHNGNLVRHSKGCILIGARPGKLGGEPAILNSRTALKQFVDSMQHQPFKLTIVGESHGNTD